MKRSELLAELARRIVAVDLSHPTRVAIDGVDAAGKTTLANELVSFVEAHGRPVIRASIDGFHNPARIRHRYYHDSFNYDALKDALLIPLGPSGTLNYRSAVFDYKSDSEKQVAPSIAARNAVLLFDGVFLLRPELRQYWDFSVFVDASFEVTLARAMQRDLSLFGGDAEVVRARYEQRYIPGQKIYLTECRPKKEATVVVDNNDPESPILLK